MTSHTPSPCFIDGDKLRNLARTKLGKAVDWDLRGNPITDACVLLTGAYGPAVLRLVRLAVQGEAGPVDAERLGALAKEAFGQAVDHNFAGKVITDYTILLSEPHGYGPLVRDLVNLAIVEQASLQ